MSHIWPITRHYVCLPVRPPLPDHDVQGKREIGDCMRQDRIAEAAPAQIQRAVAHVDAR